MKSARKHISLLMSIACSIAVCGCGTFPMTGGTDCATLRAYSGAPLASEKIATVRILKQDDVWVQTLDGRTVRFGPFPPMGAWKEIRFEVAPGPHTLVVSRPAAEAGALYNPNTGRYEPGSRGIGPYRIDFTISAEAGLSYNIKNSGTPWAGSSWEPYIEYTTAGRTNRIEAKRGK
jgi:hypothetical protein